MASLVIIMGCLYDYYKNVQEDNMSQEISDTRFAKMSQRYEQEQEENAKRIKALRLELQKSESKRMDIDTFLATSEKERSDGGETAKSQAYSKTL